MIQLQLPWGQNIYWCEATSTQLILRQNKKKRTIDLNFNDKLWLALPTHGTKYPLWPRQVWQQLRGYFLSNAPVWLYLDALFFIQTRLLGGRRRYFLKEAVKVQLSGWAQPGQAMTHSDKPVRSSLCLYITEKHVTGLRWCVYWWRHIREGDIRTKRVC